MLILHRGFRVVLSMKLTGSDLEAFSGHDESLLVQSLFEAETSLAVGMYFCSTPPTVKCFPLMYC